MKFKFPKKIIIGDTEFEIKYDKKSDGGSFAYEGKKNKANITIGLLCLKENPLHVLNIIIHELKELIQIEQGTRFRRYEEGDYLFSYSHREHTNLCSILSGLLDKFIK